MKIWGLGGRILRFLKFWWARVLVWKHVVAALRSFSVITLVGAFYVGLCFVVVLVFCCICTIWCVLTKGVWLMFVCLMGCWVLQVSECEEICETLTCRRQNVRIGIVRWFFCGVVGVLSVSCWFRWQVHYQYWLDCSEAEEIQPIRFDESSDINSDVYGSHGTFSEGPYFLCSGCHLDL